MFESDPDKYLPQFGDDCAYDFGIKEKEHELFFIEVCQKSKWHPLFEKIFRWGENISLNDVDLEKKYPVDLSGHYCKRQK